MRELRTQLEIAIQNQDVQHIAQRLSSGDTPQDPNHLGIPVLYDALKSNNLEILELLYKYKLKLNIPYNQNGYTPLIYACLYCKLETVKWLLSKGLSINDTTPLGVTAMHTAAQRGELQIAEYLYHQQADIYCKTSHGESPLFVSMTCKHSLDVFYFLLKCHKEQNRSLGNDFMRCFAYAFEKQQSDAVDAIRALLPFAEKTPNEKDIREYMAQPGNYSSSAFRSLENTLNSDLSRALFALLKSERVIRASQKQEIKKRWEDTGGL